MTDSQATDMIRALAPVGGVKPEVEDYAERCAQLRAYLVSVGGYVPKWLRK
jgi:hypothetical protein